MKRLLTAMALVTVLSSAQVPAPDFDIVVGAFIPPHGLVFQFTIAGPPNTPFGVYYVIGNIFYDPGVTIGELGSGQTDQNGNAMFFLPFQSPFLVAVPEAQLATVFFPPAAPPIPTEIVSLSLEAGPPPPPPPPLPPPPCVPSAGAMTYDPEICLVTVSIKVCPGDAVVLKKDGVPIQTSTGSTSGEVVIALNGECLAPGQTFTLEVNGALFLGPLRG
jgi:hypothetical protein